LSSWHLLIYSVWKKTIKDEKWRIVMDEEIASFKKNGTWKLVLKLNEKNPIDVKWIYKEKKNVKWEIKRYKTRLVAKEYSQKQEIDYDEIFALVTRLEIIRLIIAITV
jgi:hypothetical protein